MEASSTSATLICNQQVVNSNPTFGSKKSHWLDPACWRGLVNHVPLKSPFSKTRGDTRSAGGLHLDRGFTEASPTDLPIYANPFVAVRAEVGLTATGGGNLHAGCEHRVALQRLCGLISMCDLGTLNSYR